MTFPAFCGKVFVMNDKNEIVIAEQNAFDAYDASADVQNAARMNWLKTRSEEARVAWVKAGNDRAKAQATWHKAQSAVEALRKSRGE